VSGNERTSCIQSNMDSTWEDPCHHIHTHFRTSKNRKNKSCKLYFYWRIESLAIEYIGLRKFVFHYSDFTRTTLRIKSDIYLTLKKTQLFHFVLTMIDDNETLLKKKPKAIRLKYTNHTTITIAITTLRVQPRSQALFPSNFLFRAYSAKIHATPLWLPCDCSEMIRSCNRFPFIRANTMTHKSIL